MIIKLLFLLGFEMCMMMILSICVYAQDRPKIELEMRRVPAEIKEIKKISGPFKLRRGDIFKLSRRLGTKIEETFIDDYKFENPAPPKDSSSPDKSNIETNSPPLSANPLKATWVVDDNMGSRDPQIAVSKTHVIVTTSGMIAYYTKNGNLLQIINTGDFFSPLTNDLNSNLNIPANLANKYRINEFYDTRVIFDTYRNRFWLGALSRNSGARNGNDVDKTYRRSKFVIAVSATDDPQGDWLLYWWDAIVDDGACNDPGKLPNTGSCLNSPFSPGNGADYPAIGISKDLFIEANWTNKYALLNIVKADQLANGVAPQGQFPAWQVWNFHYTDQSVVQGTLQPAVHHGSQTSLAYLASARGDHTLMIWAVVMVNNSPLLLQKEVPVNTYGNPVAALQKASPEIPHPHDVDIGLMGNQIMKTIYRDGKLYATWHDCRQWAGANSCLTSIRLVRVNVNNFPFSVTKTIDRTFGKRHNNDPENAFFHYGWPVVEVSKDGHMVLGYNRSGLTIFPEARYSIYYGNESDISPGRILRKGLFPLGKEDPNYEVKPDAEAVGRIDNSGIAVDPSDDKTIWVIQPFSVKLSNTQGKWRLVVGKVVP